MNIKVPRTDFQSDLPDQEADGVGGLERGPGELGDHLGHGQTVGFPDVV